MKLTLENYLQTFEQFSLGHLTTEAFHPKSKNLSFLVQNNLVEALSVLREIDQDALTKLKSYSNDIYYLTTSIQETFQAGGRVFICGCGATGRLALSLEKIYRESKNDLTLKEKVVSFMAGGDYALVKSVESFEDNPEYGKKQLQELGFSKNDLLLGITEGGETSFVIGAVTEALNISKRKPFFIYCNPDHELTNIERSNNVLINNNINKLNLTVGPMAISGSTRMQATTVQMLATGMGLLYQFENKNEFQEKFYTFIDKLNQMNINFLEHFIRAEAQHCNNKGILTYIGPAQLGICILTDTTERSPTFSMSSFESTPECPIGLSYLSVKGTNNSRFAWESLLGREPRCLNWQGMDKNISQDDLYLFDISENASKRRGKLGLHKNFEIVKNNNSLSFSFDGEDQLIDLQQDDLLFNHLSLKLILNTHSTLVMGLMNRYQGNMMTFVKPSNLKLMNRAARYIKNLLQQKNISVSDEVIIRMISQAKTEDLDSGIVMAIFNDLIKDHK